MTDKDTYTNTIELVVNTLAIKKDTNQTEDSGMEEENNSENMIQDEGEDDEEEIVVKKQGNKSKQRLILDDDSDVSDSEQSKSKLQTYTRDQVLEAVMAESSHDNADEEDLPATLVTPKSRKIKRPVMDDSSSDEETERTDVVRSEVSDDTSQEPDDIVSETGSNKEEKNKVTSPSKVSNVDIQTACSDSSDSDSTSGSDGEDSGQNNQENEDEGFNEDALDPKLLAKIKKGAAKKPREKSERISKKEEMMSLHSESQRIVREGRVNLPYHQPAPKSLNDFLARATKKQQEYRSLRGAVRDSRKAKVIEGVLQNSRLQVQKKTPAETDNLNVPDGDDNDGDDENVDVRKSFRERVSDRLNKLKELNKDLDEPDDHQADEITQGPDKTVLDERITIKDIEVSEASHSDKLTNNDVTQDTEDILNGTTIECETVASTVKENSAKSVLLDKGTINMEETNDVDLGSEQGEKRKVESTEMEEQTNQAALREDLISETNAAEIKISELHEKDNLESCEEGMLYDWEKPDSCDKDSTTVKDQSAEVTVDTLSEDKENLYENSGDADMSTKRSEERMSPLKKSSPSTKSDKKLKKEKLLALAGIDLNVIKPCLSGETESFISLVEEETVPQHPGIVNLMDRLTKHNAKREKKHSKDLDISIISKDKVGMNKEELHLNTFTYHMEEEDSNPLLKLETPGAKLVALKEQLKEKIKEKREVARQKRQEIYDLDNEEGDFGAEEEEMSDHSDTDVDNEEFDEEFGEEEEVDEDEEEEGLVKEKVREKNPFADDEAEDGDDEEESEGGEDDDDRNDGDADDDDDGNENDENDNDENNDEMNLKLDVSDEEEGTSANNPSNDKPPVVRESSADTRDVGDFKEPSPKKLPEKPFSMFGQRSRDNSFTDTQIQSGQKPSSLRLQIEDSQDLYGTLPQLAHTQERSITQSSPQSFNFLLEDSQSVMLDADGYLKTKSTAKKPSKISALNDLSGTSDDMGDVLGLCSGKFVSQLESKDKSSKKSLFEDSSMSNTQNMEELMGLCSGVFVDNKDRESQKQGTKRKASSDDDHDDNLDDSIEALSDNEERISDKEQPSDDEGQSDTDHLEEDDEEEDEKIDQEEQPKKFSGFLQKKGKVRKEFVEEEAELSGSEFDSDENLDLPEEEDIMELEEADKEMANVDQEKLRDEVGRVHLKQLIDEDKRELLRFQEMYLADGDLHSEGGGRIRRFRWNNMDDDTQQDMFGDGSDGEGPEHEDTEESQWRKERYEREKFLKEQQEKEKNETEDSQFLKFGQVFLKKQGSVDGSSGTKDRKDKQAVDTLSANHGDTPGFPASFYKLSKQKRGSFLARSKETLAKIAEMTKPVSNPSAGAKSSGKFTFQVISPDKDKGQQAPPTQKQRKAHKPPQNTEPSFKKPPQKKQKLDTAITVQNSVFNHLY